MNNSLLLLIAVFAPIVLGTSLLIGRRMPERIGRILAIIGFTLPALAALVLWNGYDAAKDAATGIAYRQTLSIGLENVGVALRMGLTGLSAPLFAMAAIVGLAAGIQALNAEVKQRNLFFGLLLFMLTGLLGLFATTDALAMYFLHEFALIPTFILMVCWGGHGRRSAAIFMAVYLTIGAMLALAGIIWLKQTSGAVSFDVTDLRAAAASLTPAAQKTLFGFLLFGFGILVSLFPFHSWAPEGYSTAPSPVSMLHAGVLKKFGLFALIQVGVYALPEGAKLWAPVMLWLGLGNIVLIGLVTMVQRDLKLLISWSSVAHMGPCFLGIAAYGYADGAVTGLGGVTMMMFAHGLSVALLFVLAQAVYRRTGTFTMADMGGLAAKAPVLAGLFVAASMASIGLPGFANFWGELTIFVSLKSLVNTCPWALAAAILGVVISAIYGLRAVAAVFFGDEGETVRNRSIADIAPAERLATVVLLVALLTAGFFPRIVTGSVNDTLAAFAAAKASVQ